METKIKQLSAHDARIQSNLNNNQKVDRDVELIFKNYVYPAIKAGRYITYGFLHEGFDNTPYPRPQYISSEVIERFRNLGYDIEYVPDGETKQVRISWEE